MEHREEQTIVSLLDKDPELKKFYHEHQELEKSSLNFSINIFCLLKKNWR